MIILGIDPGTRHLGYAVVEVKGAAESALTYGTLNLSPKLDHAIRLQRIYAQVTELLDAHLPDEAAVEMPFYGKNAQSMLKLGRAQAAVMLAAMHREVPVAQYAPTEIKKALTGNGQATKDQVWFMAQQTLALDEDRGRDASDALGVALCHAYRLRGGAPGGSGTGKGKGGWGAFLSANPGRIVGGS